MTEQKGFFARRLRELREQANISQAVLADRCGLGLSTIRQFEYGRREPTYETLVRLAAGLGVTLMAFDQSAAEDAPKKPGRKKRKSP